MIGDVATLPELENLALSFLFLDDSKSSIGEVHFTLSKRLVAASPADHVHKPTPVTVAVGDAERVDEAMLEWYERFR